jgi:hypothetical protein
MRWGATDAEVRGPMPGDEIVPKASFNPTRAITIKPRAERMGATALAVQGKLALLKERR